MIAPPSACSGVSTSARKSALPMAVSNGSRFMNSAVRNGPMRTVEANTPSRPVVTAALSPMRASHPDAFAGGCQFLVASATTTNIAVEDSRQRRRMRADHQRQAEERGDCRGGAAPRDAFEAARRRRQPGEQRIHEIGQDRDRHLDGLDRLEHEKDVAGEQNAEAKRDPCLPPAKSRARGNE